MQTSETVTSNSIISDGVLKYRSKLEEAITEVVDANRQNPSLFGLALERVTGESKQPFSHSIVFGDVEFKLEQGAETKLDHVPGTVIQVDQYSIKCELVFDENSITVELPRELFPEETKYGSPIDLEMVEEAGIRKPKVSIREPDVNKNQALREKLEALVQDL